jgi:hypothetical protein
MIAPPAQRRSRTTSLIVSAVSGLRRGGPSGVLQQPLHPFAIYRWRHRRTVSKLLFRSRTRRSIGPQTSCSETSYEGPCFARFRKGLRREDRVRSPRATIISARSGNGRRIVKAASPSAVGSASSPLRFAGEIPRFADGKPRWPSVRVSANRRGFPDDKNPRNSRRLARRFPVCERIPTVLLRPAPNVGRQSLPANSVSQTERWRGRPRALSD